MMIWYGLFFGFICCLMYYWVGTFEQRKAERALGNPQKKRQKMRQLVVLQKIYGRGTRFIFSAVAVMIGVFVILRVGLNIPNAITFAIALSAPVLLYIIMGEMHKNAVRKDGRRALEYASAVFSTGGSVESWVTDVIPRLTGPLKPEFQRGAMQYKRDNTPIVFFLERLAEKMDDRFLRWAFTGIMMNYKNTGDLMKFISEVMEDLIAQERFERLMKLERENSLKLIIAMMFFPIFMYGMFSQLVVKVLEQSVVSNIILFIAVITLIGAIFFAFHMTRDEVE